jgi:hypothetical protein
MARRVVQRRSVLAKPLAAVPEDGNPQPTAVGEEDDAGIEVRTCCSGWRGVGVERQLPL